MKYNKNNFLFLVVIGLLMAAVNSYAASLDLITNQQTLKRGSKLTVDIVASEITALNGVAVSLVYPENVIYPESQAVTSTFFDTRQDDLTEEEGLGSVWSAGTATPGIIYLTGLSGDIADTDIAAGQATLFSVHFRVKNDALLGRYTIRLSSSNLCNGPAAWGTDNNNNGVFDGNDNDIKESAPLLYSFILDSRAGSDDSDEIETEILLDGFDEAPSFVFNVIEGAGTGEDADGGTEADSDSDGVSDDEDECPADPLKTEPGACGCGVPDADSDNDGIPDCRDVLIRPANGETGTAVSPVFGVKAFPNPEAAGPDAAIVWQISLNSSFTDLVFEYSGAADVTELQLPDFILDEFTTYFWRISYDAGTGDSLTWEEAGEFTTGPDSMTDEDGNGIPDDQDIYDTEVLGSLTADDAGKTLQSGADGLRYSLVAGEGVVNIDRFKWLEQEDFETSALWPVNLTDGLLSFRLRTTSLGATVMVTILFSETMPAGSFWSKTTVEQDAYDFSQNALFAEDMRSVTLTLTDGGIGDLDGVANGVIVDPGGIVRGGEENSDGSMNGKGGGSSGCFVDVCLPSNP